MTKGSTLSVNVTGMMSSAQNVVNPSVNQTTNNMKKQTVINLLSGPGVGKSTTAAGVFSLLKMHDIECELVTEYAKDLVWEERNLTVENQLYLFAKQHHRQWRLKDKVDLIITDTSLLLNNIYGKLYNRFDSETMYDFVLEEFNKYDNINFYIERIVEYNDEGRFQTKEQAEQIDNYIKEYLDENNINYTLIPGAFFGINIAIDIIFDHLGIEDRRFRISKKHGGWR